MYIKMFAAFNIIFMIYFLGLPKVTFGKGLLNRIIHWPAAQNIARISKIEVAKGSIIDSITVTYQLSNGASVTKKHGGAGGSMAPAIVLNGKSFLDIFP
jgi:hypothetical protein